MDNIPLPCCFCRTDVLEAAFLEHVSQQATGATICGGLSMSCPSCKNLLWIPVIQNEPLHLGRPEASYLLLLDPRRESVDEDYMLSRRPDPPDSEKKSH